MRSMMFLKVTNLGWLLPALLRNGRSRRSFRVSTTWLPLIQHNLSLRRPETGYKDVCAPRLQQYKQRAAHRPPTLIVVTCPRGNRGSGDLREVRGSSQGRGATTKW